MTLEPVTYDDGRGTKHLRLTVCPLCSHEFEPREKRSLHFYQEHDASDVPALSGNRGGLGAD